ncbi:MAG: CPBP family intramembrane glutamic endopeptidase [Acidimicrobiales bacterium]
MTDPADDRLEPWPPWGIPSALAGLVVGFLSAVVLGSLAVAVTGNDLNLVVVAASLAGLWSGYLGTAVFLSRAKGSGQVARDVSLRARWRDGPIGVVAGLLSSFVLVWLVYELMIRVGLLSSGDIDRLSEPADELATVARGPLAWAVLILLIGVGAPMVEEIFYRGVLQPTLIKRFGPVPGILAGAMIFGAAHQQPLQFPALAAFGAVLGFLSWRFDRLGPAIATHITFNMLTLVQLAVTQGTSG